jgi:hypothetical protein
VPVAVLFDREAAHEATLVDLLQRKGYRDLEQVREDGKAEGQAEGKEEGEIMVLRDARLLVLAQRGRATTLEQESGVAACGDPDQLRQWLRCSVVARSAVEVFDGSADGAPGL